jgi:hypothetical protein
MPGKRKTTKIVAERSTTRSALQNDRPEDVKSLARKIKLRKTDWRVEQEYAERYFAKRTERLQIVTTTRTPGGQVLDWIKPESQHPKGRIAKPPSESVTFPATSRQRTPKLAQFELENPEVTRGPAGTVPVVRRDPKTIRVSTTFQAFLSKHGESKNRLPLVNDPHAIEVPGDGAHDYAYTAQYVTCYGGEGALSCFDPYTQWSNEFSLLQILVRRGNQTIEAGWQEFRDLYGDWVPHLFVYYTTNGYSEEGDNEGGYNRDVDGWIQYSDVIYPGAIFSPTSVRGGAQYMIQVKYQLYQGNWWFCCNGRWIGYYPAGLFSTDGLRSQAEKFAAYGEVVDSSDHSGLTATDMGSGYWPEYGWTWSAYIHNLRYQSAGNGGMTNYNAGTTSASDPDQYDLETHMLSGGSWGSYLWLGGPGAG